MGSETKISWCDKTFNPWMGCTKVSPACANCYAERDMDIRWGKVKWGPQGTRVLTSESNWNQPKKWNREAGEKGIRYRVFCASLADVFEDWQGEIKNHNGELMEICSGCRSWYSQKSVEYFCCGEKPSKLTIDDVRCRLFSLTHATPNLDWLLLTKRPENIQKMWPERRENVWLGATVENQEYADKRIPELLKCRGLANHLFLSCEPLLGPIELLKKHLITPDGYTTTTGRKISIPSGIDWVIAGSESGPNKRETKIEWFESLQKQCDLAGIPFFMKQMEVDGVLQKDIEQFPNQLRIQEFPGVRS